MILNKSVTSHRLQAGARLCWGLLLLTSLIKLPKDSWLLRRPDREAHSGQAELGRALGGSRQRPGRLGQSPASFAAPLSCDSGLGPENLPARTQEHKTVPAGRGHGQAHVRFLQAGRVANLCFMRAGPSSPIPTPTPTPSKWHSKISKDVPPLDRRFQCVV